MSVHHFPQVTLTIDGQVVPTNGVSVSTDSPLDLHLPPNVGNFPGSDANADLALTAPVTHRPEVPWSPTFRARPGTTATVDVDGTRVFTGFVDDAGVSLAAGDVNVGMVDPLHYVDRNFSAPATLKRLAPLPGSSQERPVGCSGLYYVDRALAALGVNSTVPIAERTDLHVGMCGNAHPYVGTVTAATQTDPVNGGPVIPPVEALWRPMSGGRVGALNPRFEYVTREPTASTPTVGSWHLMHEIDPTQSGTVAYQVRTRALTGQNGFGMWINGDRMRVLYWDIDGDMHFARYMDQGQRLIDVPLHSTHERILLVYNTVDNFFELRRYRADGQEAAAYFRFEKAGDLPIHAPSTKQLRVFVLGRGVVGAVSLMSRAAQISSLDNPYVNTHRGVSYDLSTSRLVRWSRHGLPPVEGEPAVPWLMAQIAAMRIFIYTDDNGVIHLSDPADWPNLPVSHVISDGIVAGDIDLDDVQVTVARRRKFSNVRVTGTPVLADIAWGPGMKPNRIYAGARGETTIRPGDDPIELWLEPRDGEFWGAPPDMDFRWAGEAVTAPWHLPDDFARGRGSWWGGHVRRHETDNFYRWAEPGDVIFTAELVGASRVKITMAPGPTLLAGEEFVNFPNPESTSLREQNPSKLTQPLPVLRGSGVGYYGEVQSVSAEMTPDPEGWGDLAEYVHEAGLNVQSTGQAEELAQIFADSHEDDFGLVTVRCALDTSVKVGQRVHVKPTSRSDVTLDGVVTGIPNRDVPSGSAPSMTLSLWVLTVVANSITYAERAALGRQADLAAGGDGDDSYVDDQARVGNRTYAQEGGLTPDGGLYPTSGLLPDSDLYPRD